MLPTLRRVTADVSAIWPRLGLVQPRHRGRSACPYVPKACRHTQTRRIVNDPCRHPCRHTQTRDDRNGHVKGAMPAASTPCGLGALLWSRLPCALPAVGVISNDYSYVCRWDKLPAAGVIMVKQQLGWNGPETVAICRQIMISLAAILMLLGYSFSEVGRGSSRPTWQ